MAMRKAAPGCSFEMTERYEGNERGEMTERDERNEMIERGRRG